MTIHLVIHEVLCATLFYSLFCRSVRLDSTSRLDVRFSFFVLAVVSIMGMAWPFVSGDHPGLFDLALLGSVTLVQVVTARHWAHGVPPSFSNKSRG